MSALELKDATVTRRGHNILASASIRAAAGELLVVLGPNGSGKSTLLRVFAGLWSTTSGSATLDGKKLQEFPRNELARRIAFVPQDTHVDFAFTVSEILAMGRYPHRGRFSSETEVDRSAIRLAAEQCDVSHLLDRSIDTLSGGERQRVLIARSLAVQPEFILLDEPTANLDIEHSLEVLDLIRAFTAKGVAVVLASHDLNLVAGHATRIALLQAGRIVGAGVPEDILLPATLKQVFKVQARPIASTDGSKLFAFERSASHGHLERSNTPPDPAS